MKLGILFALALTALEAQTIEVREFFQLAPLDGEWKYSTSDDPRFAAPDFNDSAWQTFRVPDQGAPAGAYWIRFRVQLPDQLPAEPLALLLPPLSAGYELFINGRSVGSFGDARAGMGWATRVPAAADFAVTSGSRQLSVAIRMPVRTISISTPVLARSAWIGTARAIAGKKRQAEFEVRWPSVSHLAVMSGTAMAALFFLFLPVWRRDAREYFWCGLFLLGAVLMRPMTMASWMMDGVPYPLVIGVMTGVGVLLLVSWTRLFSLLLGVRLSKGIRRVELALLLLLLSQFPLIFLEWAPVIILSITPVLTSVYWGVVYLDLARRAPPKEETIWMHTAVGVYLGGMFGFYALRLPMIDQLAAMDAADLAAHVRGMGALLFAGVMAMVLNRRSARLQIEQERLAQEMRAGAEMQALLLPAASADGVDSVYLPASEVGGDFYQILDRADGSRVVLVGDVSGKGLKAAMLVSVAVGILRNEKSSSPAAILGAMNKGLSEHTGSGFVTCCCARIDPDGTVTLANAGHPAPYCDGREVELSPGLPLGVIQDMPYGESVVPGERFTFVSDGVVEAENAQRELFGFDRTRAISTKSAREIAEAAKAWGQNDDITVVTVRRNS